MDVCCCGDGEIDGSSARFPAAADDRRCQPPPLARDGGVDGEWVEGGLDDAEPLGSPGALILLDGHKEAEVQLGERGGAYGALQLARAFSGNQDRGVEKYPHLFGEASSEVTGKRSQVVVKHLRRGRLPDSLQRGTRDPPAWTGRAELGHWSARDGHSELFAGFGPPQHLTDVVAQFLLRDRGHDYRVALLLPTGPLLCPGME